MPNVYEIVTERIIAQMEKGVVPWRKPWKTELPCNMVSGKPYRGLNVFLLASQGFGSRYWLTFAQCQKLGGQVMKGEKSTLVIFWKIGQEKIVKDPVTGQEPKSRLHRDNFDSAHAFGSESYSKEELVAELGASMLAGIAGIETATLNNSAAYLRHWIDRLKSDSKLLVSAASQAQKAGDYILA